MNITELFLEAETQFQLNGAMIEDYYFWDYNRFYIYNEASKQVNNEADAHEHLNYAVQLIRCASLIPNSLVHNYHAKREASKLKGEPIWLVKCHPRRMLIGGSSVSVYTDLLSDLYSPTISFEETDEFQHAKNVYTHPLFYLDKIEIVSRIMYLLNKFLNLKQYKRMRERLYDRMLEVLVELERRIGIRLDKSKIVEKMLRRYYLVIWARKYWTRIFKVYNIKGIIEVVHYNIFSMCLNEVAHKNGCNKIIEMQHGLISDIHIAYQYRMINKALLPNYIFTFSDYWSKQINIEDSYVELVPIGFQYLNEYVNRTDSSERKNALVIISQGNHGDGLSQLALDISQYCLEQKNGFVIYYKLHPSEAETASRRYSALYQRKNIIVVGKERSAYDLFSICRYAVGHNSTALIEALGFGLCCMTTDDEDSMISSLVKDHYLLRIGSVQDYWNVFNRGCTSFAFETVKGTNTQLWKDAARKNFMDTIRKIVGE